MVYELHKSQRLFISEEDAMKFKGAVDCIIDGLDPSDNIKKLLVLYRCQKRILVVMFNSLYKRGS